MQGLLISAPFPSAPRRSSLMEFKLVRFATSKPVERTDHVTTRHSQLLIETVTPTSFFSAGLATSSLTQIPIDIRQSCLRTSSVYTKQGVIVKLHHKWLMMHSCSSHHPQSDPRLRLKPAATGLQLQLVDVKAPYHGQPSYTTKATYQQVSEQCHRIRCKYGWLCGLLVRTGSGLLGEHPDDDARAPWQEDQNQVSSQN